MGCYVLRRRIRRMNFKHIIFGLCMVMMLAAPVAADPFNIPIQWVLQDNGTSIDQNNNNWPDYADNALNASSAGDANTLGGELPSYYLDYDNMNAGSIPDGYIDSAATWNDKA